MQFLSDSSILVVQLEKIHLDGDSTYTNKNLPYFIFEYGSQIKHTGNQFNSENDWKRTIMFTREAEQRIIIKMFKRIHDGFHKRIKEWALPIKFAVESKKLNEQIGEWCLTSYPELDENTQPIEDTKFQVHTHFSIQLSVSWFPPPQNCQGSVITIQFNCLQSQTQKNEGVKYQETRLNVKKNIKKQKKTAAKRPNNQITDEKHLKRTFQKQQAITYKRPSLKTIKSYDQ